jgi:hypothetical protein
VVSSNSRSAFDFAGSLGLGWLCDGENGSSKLSSSSELFRLIKTHFKYLQIHIIVRCRVYLAVSFLGTVEFLGEDNQFRFVFLESVNVGLESFDRAVLSAVVNRDTDGKSFLASDSSSL